VPAPKVEKDPSEPELEVPHSASMKRAMDSKFAGELVVLGPGDVFGGDTFKEHGAMEHSLVAKTDVVACRVGYDEVCQALRGFADHTPPLEWIITRNEVKNKLHKMFPFEALYEETLDRVLEGFERQEYAPNASIVNPMTEEHFFFLIVEGEAVQHTQGQAPEALTKGSTFGTVQLLLQAPYEVEISAAATGCAAMVLSCERFAHAVGVLMGELQTKTRYAQLNLTLKQDIFYLGALGEGQFGVVRRVQVRGLFGEDFALKRISKRRVIELDQQSSCALERELLSEACHPLIVRLIRTFQDDTSVYLLMECLGGGDLFSAIRDLGSLNEEHSLFFGASMVLPIDYLHAHGFIYRDLKPENVMLDAHGYIKLVDFGCCTRKTRSYTFVGTPEYLAPEVILGTGYGKAVDWWGIGVIMYEMIVGPLPFGTGESNDPMDTFREVLEKPLNVPGWVQDTAADLLKCLLERMPELRLGSSTMHEQNEVREHAYFAGLNWDAILEHSTKPPYQPPHAGGSTGHVIVRSSSAPCEEATAFSPSGSFRLEGSASNPCMAKHAPSPSGSASPDPRASPASSHLLPPGGFKNIRPMGGPTPGVTIVGDGQVVDELEYGKVPDDEEEYLPPSPLADLKCFDGF
jgi:cGMP-dependent protein kinase